MKNIEEHVALLRYMASVLRERKSNMTLTDYQRAKSEKGIVALDRAVEALQVQVYA